MSLAEHIHIFFLVLSLTKTLAHLLQRILTIVTIGASITTLYT